MASRTWIVNTPLQVGSKTYGYGDEVKLTDEQAVSMPAGVISLKDESDADADARESYEDEHRVEVEGRLQDEKHRAEVDDPDHFAQPGTPPPTERTREERRRRRRVQT